MEELAAMLPNQPDIRGEGTLFAYSGMDGETRSTSGFVGGLWSRQYDILCRLKD